MGAGAWRSVAAAAAAASAGVMPGAAAGADAAGTVGAAEGKGVDGGSTAAGAHLERLGVGCAVCCCKSDAAGGGGRPRGAAGGGTARGALPAAAGVNLPGRAWDICASLSGAASPPWLEPSCTDGPPLTKLACSCAAAAALSPADRERRCANTPPPGSSLVSPTGAIGAPKRERLREAAMPPLAAAAAATAAVPPATAAAYPSPPTAAVGALRPAVTKLPSCFWVPLLREGGGGGGLCGCSSAPSSGSCEGRQKGVRGCQRRGLPASPPRTVS